MIYCILIIVILAIIYYLYKQDKKDIDKNFNNDYSSNDEYTGKQKRRAWISNYEKIKIVDTPWIFNSDPLFYMYDSPIWNEKIDGNWYSDDIDTLYNPNMENYEEFDIFDFDLNPDIPNKIIDFEIVGD